MADVWDNGPEDPIDCATLLVLANFANERGQSCYPSVVTIARMTRRSIRTIERSIATLEADGWIRIATRGNGAGNVTAYVLDTARLKGRQGDGVSAEQKGDTGTPFQKVKGRQPDGVPESERASDGREKGVALSQKGVSGDTPIEEPLEPRTEPGRDAKRPAPQNKRPGLGASGEFMLATDLLRELKLSTGQADIRAVAEQIWYETPDRGGAVEAADFIKTQALAAIERGERVTIFWIKDRKFAEADVYAAFLAKEIDL